VAYFRFSTTEPGLTSPFATMSPSGLITWWNGTAFETYESDNWSTYDIALTEGRPPGIYSGEWPTGLSTGYYDLFLYEYIGGTAATDRLVGSGTEYLDSTLPNPSAPTFSGLWRLAGSNETDNTTETLYINDGDTVPLAFSFQRFLDIQQGESLSTAVITPPTGVTVGTVTLTPYLAVADFSGDANATAYTITIDATFTNGATVTRTRKLLVS